MFILNYMSIMPLTFLADFGPDGRALLPSHFWGAADLEIEKPESYSGYAKPLSPLW